MDVSGSPSTRADPSRSQALEFSIAIELFLEQRAWVDDLNYSHLIRIFGTEYGPAPGQQKWNGLISATLGTLLPARNTTSLYLSTASGSCLPDKKRKRFSSATLNALRLNGIADDESLSLQLQILKDIQARHQSA
ncbi:hypothetical protein TNIN_484661, partial [Trichonephila inaurata madagascariensis]